MVIARNAGGGQRVVVDDGEDAIMQGDGGGAVGGDGHAEGVMGDADRLTHGSDITAAGQDAGAGGIDMRIFVHARNGQDRILVLGLSGQAK